MDPKGWCGLVEQSHGTNQAVHDSVKREYTDADILEAIRRDDSNELARIVVTVALYHEDFAFAFDVCRSLAGHLHPNVRGNAILGFGHLARRFGQLDEKVVKPLIEAGLKDCAFEVSGQAWAAASDVSHFLGWRLEGFCSEPL